MAGPLKIKANQLPHEIRIELRHHIEARVQYREGQILADPRTCPLALALREASEIAAFFTRMPPFTTHTATSFSPTANAFVRGTPRVLKNSFAARTIDGAAKRRLAFITLTGLRSSNAEAALAILLN
jgi:hypothetical protein